MTNSTERNARDIPVHEVMVWYHLPFSIEEPLDPQGLGSWKESSIEASDDQLNYFHPYVSEALFKGAARDGSAPRIAHWRRLDLVAETNGGALDANLVVDLQADRSVKGQGISTTTFRGAIEDVSLRTVLPDKDTKKPGMGIVVVGVRFSKKCEATPAASEHEDLQNPDSLTLADAQNVIDLSRRIFPRWEDKTAAEDGAEPFYGDMIARLRLIGHLDRNRWQSVGGLFQKAPWIKCLMKPWRIDQTALTFGDERSFVTSAILLEEDRESYDARNAVLAASNGDLFRLAEADSAGEGYGYQKEFVDDRLKRYRYDRHAPALDGLSGNATIILIAHHHLCILAAGKHMDKFLFAHTNSYYRHLQFLCVYEYFYLVQFSQRLTKLVQAKNNPGFDFAGHLRDLRQDFLNFTHINHFSNVSHQLQPREMFDQLYREMEIGDRFREVEDELRVASEFQAARHNAEAADRAENLNDLIGYSIPLTLIAGLTGANLFIGTNDPTRSPDEGGAETVLDLGAQLAHGAGVVAIVAIFWALACSLIALRIDKSASPSGMKSKNKYCFQAGFWFIVGAIATGVAWVLW